MEDPERDITKVIRLLCQTPPSIQRHTIERYFTPDASFTHPFCRTGSFDGSRWFIWIIFRFYKMMSPRIEIDIDSIAYDKENLILYVTLHQVFRFWPIPFYAARVNLTTLLRLQEDRQPALASEATDSTESAGESDAKTQVRYLIKSQSDLYEVYDFAKFLSVFGIVETLYALFAYFGTAVCTLGVFFLWPITWYEQNLM